MRSGSRSAGRERERRKRSWSARAGGPLCWPGVGSGGGRRGCRRALGPGAGGLASLAKHAPGEFLTELSDRGVPLMTFGGTGITLASQ